MAVRKTPAVNDRITPLTVIASLLGVCEAVTATVAALVNGSGVQVALVVFIIVFPLVIVTAFFAILWNRPWVLYPPSAYGGDPMSFIRACKWIPEDVKRGIENVQMGGSGDSSNTATFSLISSLIDNATKQVLIFMNEFDAKLPLNDIRIQFVAGCKDSWWQNGNFSGVSFSKKLSGTGLLEPALRDGAVILTKVGREFASWLVCEKEKADFFESGVGGWGTPIPPMGVFYETHPNAIAREGTSKPR